MNKRGTGVLDGIMYAAIMIIIYVTTVPIVDNVLGLIPAYTSDPLTQTIASFMLPVLSLAVLIKVKDSVTNPERTVPQGQYPPRF